MYIHQYYNTLNTVGFLAVMASSPSARDTGLGIREYMRHRRRLSFLPCNWLVIDTIDRLYNIAIPCELQRGRCELMDIHEQMQTDWLRKNSETRLRTGNLQK